jgi:hypothetical protein
MKKILLAMSVVAALGAAAGPALAQETDLPVTVTRDNGGVQVRSGIPGQPLLSVSADDNGVCTGFSYQQGACVDVVQP